MSYGLSVYVLRLLCRVLGGVHFLRSSGFILHMILSAFWVSVYEILLYLKHGMDPVVLHEQMRLIFSKNTPSRSWVGSWWSQKVERVKSLFSCLPLSLSSQGRLPFNLDGLDSTWFCNYFRDATRKMEPLSPTLTGLKSPTNDKVGYTRPGDGKFNWFVGKVHRRQSLAMAINTVTEITMRQMTTPEGECY